MQVVPLSLLSFIQFVVRFVADQERLDFEAKKLQSIVKEKSLIISEKGALSDKISPGILRSLVTLTDKK